MQYKVDLNFPLEYQNRILYDKYKKIILTEFRQITCEIDKTLKTFYEKREN